MRYKKTVYCGRVAQLDRVPGYEPGGRRFDSCRVRHIEKTSLMTGFFSPNILFLSLWGSIRLLLTSNVRYLLS
jgi:hypothetical protein